MTTTVEAVGLPFDEAIAFFRQKVNITTQRWTDVWRDGHSRGFMVAGAASQALVGDFRTAVAKALETGTTLAEFRGSFESIVDQHGWSYHGTPGWRSRIIYETNLSTAYSAGRYAQLTEPDTLAVFPYWQYVHSGARHPRLEHLGWNGLTLRADDPWWGTHFPPNGWRCGCRARPVSGRDLGRMGKTVPDQAPPLDIRTVNVPGRGAVQVPAGIDPGFDYNPGAAWQRHDVGLPGGAPSLRPGGAPVVPLPPAGDRADASAAGSPTASPAALRAFLANPAGDVVVGLLHDAARVALDVDSATVRLSAATMQKQRARHPELTEADYLAVPALLAAPALAWSDRVRHLVVVEGGARRLRAVLKATETGRAVFMQSLRRAGPGELRRAALRHRLIIDDGSAMRESDDGAE